MILLAAHAREWCVRAGRCSFGLAVVLLAIAPLPQVTGQESRPADLDRTAKPVSTRPDARMTLRLPGAISQHDLQRYQRLLVLAAPQRLFVQKAHERYLAAISATLQERMPALDALNAEATAQALSEEAMRKGITFTAVKAAEAVYDMQDAIERDLLQAEHVFFAEMDSVLAEQQRETLPRVFDDRRRARCTSFAYRVIRASCIDLSTIVERTVHDGEVLERVNNLLREYEARLTPLTVALESEMRKQDLSIPRMLAWRERDEQDRRLSDKVHVQRSVESIDIQRSLVAEGARLQKQIAELNASTLPRLLELLPQAPAATVAALCQETSYPAVYPDRYETGFDLCARGIDAAELTATQREAVNALCETYRASYRATCERMENRCREWQEFYARTRFTMDQYEPYRMTMRELRDKRWQLGLTLARQVQGIVPPETSPDLHQQAANAQRLIEFAMEQAKSPRDSYPGI